MLINKIIEYGIISLAIFSPLAFGSVEVWAYTVVELVVLLLVTISVLKIVQSSQFTVHPLPGIKYLITLTFAFVIIILFQIIPLPSDLMRIISPKTYNLYTDLSLEKRSFMTVSIYPYATRFEFLKLLSYIGIFFLTISAIDTKEKTRRFIRILIIFGFTLSIFGIIQKASWNGKIYWFRELSQGGNPFGPFVNRNHFAGYIGMIIPMAMAYLFTLRKKEKQIIYGFMAMIMALSLFYSTSRGGVVTFLAGLAFFTAIMLFRRLKNKGLWVIATFGICLSVYLLYLGIIDPVLERFIKTDLSSEQRFLVWKGTWDGLRDFLPFGSGLGTFQYLFPMYKPLGITLYYDHAHNDYLEFLLETGIAGVSILILFLWYLLSIFSGQANKPASLQAGKLGSEFYIRLGLLISIFIMLLHSIIDFNLHIPSNAILFSLILGLYVRGGISDV